MTADFEALEAPPMVTDDPRDGDPNLPDGDDFLGGATGVDVALGGEGLRRTGLEIGEVDRLRGEDERRALNEDDSALEIFLN